MMLHSLKRWWPGALVFALAFGLRCYGLGAPLLDYHSWRQADTAAMARNFVASHFWFSHPQVDWGGTTPGYVESEFPLYAGSLALLWGVFGAQVWLGRLLSAVAGGLAPVLLYALVRPISGRRTALFAGLALALMPFAVYFGRAVMPDTWMLLAGIAALWAFHHWLEQPSAGRFRLALLLGALAPLAKTPNLVIIGVPLLYMAWPMIRERAARLPLLIYGLCFATPTLLWMQHARALPLDPRLSFGIGEKLFDVRLLADPQFYELVARWSVSDVLTWAGVPLFLVGLVLGRKALPSAWAASPFPLLPHAWLVGVLLFVLVGAAGVVGQDYYLLPLAASAAWLVGIGCDRTERWAAARWRRAGRLVPVASLGALAVFSAVRIAPLYQTTDFYGTLGERVNLALPAGARVGVIAPAVSEILWYGERKGWRLDPGVIVPGGLASLGPDLGVRYLLIADPWLSERRDVLTEALGQFRRVPVGPFALMFDLQEPSSAAPFEMAWETGHIVRAPFLAAWHERGGVNGLGFPISDALEGPEGREQFFERAVLRQKGNRAERLAVGLLMLEAYGRAPQPAVVDPAFATMWQAAGGEAALGEPLGPRFAAPDGATIQCFRYGTLEQPPGGTPTEGASGRRLLQARGLTEEQQIMLAARAAAK